RERPIGDSCFNSQPIGDAAKRCTGREQSPTTNGYIQSPPHPSHPPPHPIHPHPPPLRPQSPIPRPFTLLRVLGQDNLTVTH
ncbi:hypothetical protein BaRGS_00021378, partial [Batillaria attramentaria]